VSKIFYKVERIRINRTRPESQALSVTRSLYAGATAWRGQPDFCQALWNQWNSVPSDRGFTWSDSKETGWVIWQENPPEPEGGIGILDHRCWRGAG